MSNLTQTLQFIDSRLENIIVQMLLNEENYEVTSKTKKGDIYELELKAKTKTSKMQINLLDNSEDFFVTIIEKEGNKISSINYINQKGLKRLDKTDKEMFLSAINQTKDEYGTKYEMETDYYNMSDMKFLNEDEEQLTSLFQTLIDDEFPYLYDKKITYENIATFFTELKEFKNNPENLTFTTKQQ